MKVLSAEEIAQHNHAAHMGMIKGAIYGIGVSLAGAAIAKRNFSHLLKKANWQIKTALFISPIAFSSSVVGELDSTAFGRQLHHGDMEQEKLEEIQRWNSLTMEQKCFHTLNENRFSLLFTSWAAVLLGSWKVINRDKILTQSQKLVQARMYAQFATVVLVFGVLGISYYDRIINPQDFEEENQETRLDRILANIEKQNIEAKQMQLANQKRLEGQAQN